MKIDPHALDLFLSSLAMGNAFLLDLDYVINGLNQLILDLLQRIHVDYEALVGLGRFNGVLMQQLGVALE